MTTSCLVSHFWEIFTKKLYEFCDLYNLVKGVTDYEIYNICNDKYIITISEYSHQQCEEIELETILVGKNDNKVKYKNKYVMLLNYPKNSYTLTKPINEFIDEIFNNLQNIIYRELPNGLWYINKRKRRLNYEKQNTQIYSKDIRRIYYNLNYTEEAKRIDKLRVMF